MKILYLITVTSVLYLCCEKKQSHNILGYWVGSKEIKIMNNDTIRSGLTNLKEFENKLNLQFKEGGIVLISYNEIDRMFPDTASYTINANHLIIDGAEYEILLLNQTDLQISRRLIWGEINIGFYNRKVQE